MLHILIRIRKSKASYKIQEHVKFSIKKKIRKWNFNLILPLRLFKCRIKWGFCLFYLMKIGKPDSSVKMLVSI